MFLLESAALPGENDFCVCLPIPPSSFPLPACVRRSGKNSVASPTFLSLWVEKATGISQNNLGEVTGWQINCPEWLWPLFSAFG